MVQLSFEVCQERLVEMSKWLESQAHGTCVKMHVLECNWIQFFSGGSAVLRKRGSTNGTTRITVIYI